MVYDWFTENDEISVSLECLWTSCLPRYICEKLVWPSTWLIQARFLLKMRTTGMVGILAWGHFSVSSSTWMHWGLNSEICKYAGVSNSVSKPRMVSGCGANEMVISGVPDLITPSLYPMYPETFQLTFLQEAVWEQLPGPLHGCRKPFDFFEFPKCTRSIWDEHHTRYTTRLEGFTAGSRWSRFFRSLPHQDSQSGLGRRLLLLVSRKKNNDFSYCFNHVYSRYNHVYVLYFLWIIGKKFHAYLMLSISNMAVGKNISFRLTLPLFDHLRFREVCWPWKRIQNKSHHPTHQKPEPEHFQEVFSRQLPRVREAQRQKLWIPVKSSWKLLCCLPMRLPFWMSRKFV